MRQQSHVILKMSVRQLRQLIREGLDIAPGYWVTPQGEVIPVPSDKLHYEIAAEILGTSNDPEGDDTIDAADVLEMNGGIRLRNNTPNCLTITMRNLRKPELRRLQDGLARIGYPRTMPVILAPGDRSTAIHTTVDALMAINDQREL